MKKIILIAFSILLTIVSFGQDSNILAKNVYLGGSLYSDKSGSIDTIITYHTDSAGQYRFMNMADPVDSLDGVNLRTLQAATFGSGVDSSDFNTSTGYQYFYSLGAEQFNVSLDGRYQLIDSMTNYVEKADSATLYYTQYDVDSIINARLAPNEITISLPNAGDVLTRISSAVSGTDYPSDWTLSVGTSSVDLDITHNEDKYVTSVTVFSNTSGTQRQQLFNSAAYNGIICSDSNHLTIQSLSRVPTRLYIYITFAQ